MADKEKKKGIFGKAVDAFSSKDEKEEIEKLEEELAQAKKEAEAARKTVQSLRSSTIEAKKDKSSTEEEMKAAEKKIEELEKKLKAQMDKDRERLAAKRKGMMEERLARAEAAKKPALMTKHTVEADETLSHIALKYYKHATPPYWKFLLEHNQDVLKGDEKSLRAGMVLEIPELPENLKD